MDNKEIFESVEFRLTATKIKIVAMSTDAHDFARELEQDSNVNIVISSQVRRIADELSALTKFCEIAK